MRIKKGDTVKILYGKDKGKRGPVVAVDVKKEKVIVEGLNLYKKHIKGDGQSKTSEIITIEKPFPVSKIMLICPSCDKPTRVSSKIEDDKKIRICKKCGKEIVSNISKEKKEETKVDVTKKQVKKAKSKTKNKIK
ncbi:MAG: 50S ribosomal protein L24 [Candidatus Dojkabacteria bacterium]|jgi:large subunit ribosomal protein L24|nr:50S ribosomal protein L24 [Candidatus Dojkabacteria bacterium]MDD4561271.1 50S ribosomal protein L24 [Candidatus Dojkabacteria bacterium]